MSRELKIRVTALAEARTFRQVAEYFLVIQKM